MELICSPAELSQQWFAKRKLDFKPLHFHQSNIPLTQEMLNWVWENTTGRFSVARPMLTPGMTRKEAKQHYIAFESTTDKLLYELTWG